MNLACMCDFSYGLYITDCSERDISDAKTDGDKTYVTQEDRREIIRVYRQSPGWKRRPLGGKAPMHQFSWQIFDRIWSYPFS